MEALKTLSRLSAEVATAVAEIKRGLKASRDPFLMSLGAKPFDKELAWDDCPETGPFDWHSKGWDVYR